MPKFRFQGFSTESHHFNSKAGNEVFATIEADDLSAAIEKIEKPPYHVRVVWIYARDLEGGFLREKVGGEWLNLEDARQKKIDLGDLPPVF